MANPEHLKILRERVRAWNKWRNENPNIQPDLSGADLNRFQLHNRNLRGADLREANLGGIDLPGADFRRADLSGAKLSGANLRGTKLSGAKLDGADLSGADLDKVDLSGASLKWANLVRAKISNTKLAKANLNKAIVRVAEVIFTNMEEANLEDADFSYSSLVGSNLTDANLTGIKLYGTSRDDWIIKNVKCEYVYWDEDGEQRSPKDRDLEPGEFERLYAALPIIEYIFESGMTPIDPLIMDRVVQAIREKQPEFDIKIDSINARGLAPSIKFTVQHEENKEPALTEVRKEYQIKQAQLEGKIEEISKHIRNLIDKPSTINIINAPQAKYLAIDGSTLNVEETSNYYAYELRKVIEQEPEESESFAKVAKKTALDVIGGAIKDIAKGQVKEAAKQIIELGIDLGPLFVRMAPLAYEFFKNVVT